MGFELACMQATFFNKPPEFSYTAATPPAVLPSSRARGDGGSSRWGPIIDRRESLAQSRRPS